MVKVILVIHLKGVEVTPQEDHRRKGEMLEVEVDQELEEYQ